MYDRLSDCRVGDDPSKPYELKLPDGHKAFAVYTCDRYHNIWVNAKDGQGKTVLLTGGDDYDMCGLDGDGSCT